MKKKFTCCLIVPFFVLYTYAQVNVELLRTENLINPIGISAQKPCFSWQLVSNQRNIMQSSYEIVVAENSTAVWKSGKVKSDSSVRVSYKGPALKSGTKYNWYVNVWYNNDKPAPRSKPAFFLTALLNTRDWQATWIEPGFVEDSVMRPSPLFRKEFVATKKIKSAIAYITAHGMYEAQINNKRVGDALLTPGWTAYKKRLQFQTYDVTGMLSSGANAIAVTLGSGWYRGSISTSRNIPKYGKDIALLFQLNITYTDGTKQIVSSDNSWKSSTGSIRYSDIYNGETIDANKEKTGWALPLYNDKDWDGVKVINHSKDNLVATINEPVKKQEVFKPLKIIRTPLGENVIDFGQNLVGWLVLKVKGKAGDTITISHAEVLDKKGNFYVENLRSAKAQNKYILKGTGEKEIFEPHFTWQGFRYIKVEGYAGELLAEDFEAVALYSDMEHTGTFYSSNALINQLQHNIQWGQRGNFVDVPTDCPQRDERLGWTGDAQAFCRTATFNMNVNNFFAKWLQDLEAEQENGEVPVVVPNIQADAGSVAGWADVATIAPWDLYLAYGDKTLLHNQYKSMKAYVEGIRRIAKNNLWNTGFQFGDWLFYSPDNDADGSAAVTDKYFIAQCFYAHSCQLLINAAKVLDHPDDVVTYTKLLSEIKAAFFKEYVTPNGRLISGTQTAYVLALNFDMLPDKLRQQAALKLVENIRNYDNHITTGFLGTPYINHVLTRFGYTDIAYKLLLQQTYPSWLYPVKMGATTIWERWDGQKPDSSFQTPAMNSFNHYAYGAIGDWMYRKMAGLDTYEDGPGYKHIKVMPNIGGDFTQAAAVLKTYYGNTSAGWKIEGKKLMLSVEVPPNTYATIYIPASDINNITESNNSLSSRKDIKFIGKENSCIVLQVGSGSYYFSVVNYR